MKEIMLTDRAESCRQGWYRYSLWQEESALAFCPGSLSSMQKTVCQRVMALSQPLVGFFDNYEAIEGQQSLRFG